MLTPSQTFHQLSLFETDLLLQLDATDPLLQLAAAIPWDEFDDTFSVHYTKGIGAPSKPIRLMVGLLILKQLENLSDEAIVLQWKRNPYYQAFCGVKEFQRTLPCHSTELVRFRDRIGAEGVDRIFRMSVDLHGEAALEDAVHIDTTAHVHQRSQIVASGHPAFSPRCKKSQGQMRSQTAKSHCGYLDTGIAPTIAAALPVRTLPARFSAV